MSPRFADRVGRGAAHEALDQAAGDRGGQQRLAGRHRPHGLGELRGRGVLEHEAAGACPQSLVPLSAVGGSIVTGAYWIAVGYLMQQGALERPMAAQAVPAAA